MRASTSIQNWYGRGNVNAHAFAASLCQTMQIRIHFSIVFFAIVLLLSCFYFCARQTPTEGGEKIVYTAPAPMERTHGRTQITCHPYSIDSNQSGHDVMEGGGGRGAAAAAAAGSIFWGHETIVRTHRTSLECARKQSILHGEDDGTLSSVYRNISPPCRNRVYIQIAAIHAHKTIHGPTPHPHLRTEYIFFFFVLRFVGVAVYAMRRHNRWRNGGYSFACVVLKPDARA